VTSLIHIRY